MGTAITNERDVHADAFQRVFQRISFYTPFAVIATGLLIRLGILNGTYYMSDTIFLAVSIAFMVIGTWQYVKTKPSQLFNGFVCLAYHILGAAFVLFVSGIYSPAIALWIILLAGTDYYFGRKALFLSTLTLVSTAWLALLIHPPKSGEEIANNVVMVLLVSLIGYILSSLRRTASEESLAYRKSRRHEQLQHDRLVTLINGLGDAVIGTDKGGKIRIYNAATLGLLDTNQTLSGHDINTILNLHDKGGKSVSVKALLKNATHIITRTDLKHHFTDGEEMNVYLNIAPIKPSYNNKTIQQGYIFILRDITKEKSLEEERDEFVSVISHELRTPVSITEGNLSNILMLTGMGAGTPEQIRQSITAAHEQVLYLASMINDLSALSRAERGTHDEPEDIDVTEMLNVLYLEYHSQADIKGLRCDLDVGPNLGKVRVSRLYLEEIIQNFITNAIKYTSVGSVTVSARNTGSGDITFAVKDTGIGMSKTDQKHIFEKFWRSEDYRTRETSGTGLGLYVVHKLASKLGVEIEFTSRLNHGSEFKFTLPKLQEANAPAPARTPTPTTRRLTKPTTSM